MHEDVARMGALDVHGGTAPPDRSQMMTCELGGANMRVLDT